MRANLKAIVLLGDKNIYFSKVPKLIAAKSYKDNSI
jgi:hypothetical protein